MIILIIALVLLWSHPAWAVPVFDAANATTITEVDTVSTSITVAGTNRLMIGCATFNADRSISSFTYNSVGLTSVLSDFVATRQETAMYRLTVGGMSFTGAHQTVPLDTAVSDADLTEASATVAPSSATTDLVAGCFGKEGVAATAGDTSRASAGTLSLVTQTGAASVTLDWSWADSFQYWAAVGVSINPVATQRPIPPQVWQ
jgi:hypothetical protein